jgi:hypothetical protein
MRRCRCDESENEGGQTWRCTRARKRCSLGFFNFRPRKYYAKDEKRRNRWPFRRNSASYAEWKRRGIPFRFLQNSRHDFVKRKQGRFSCYEKFYLSLPHFSIPPYLYEFRLRWEICGGKLFRNILYYIVEDAHVFLLLFWACCTCYTLRKKTKREVRKMM